MALAGLSFFTVPGPSAAEPVYGAGLIVVWMRGEHDISTDGALCQTLARAIALDRLSIVLDLSEVNLMSASTLGVIVAARELLSRQSRSLKVRSPSVFVRRIIGVCGLDNLLGLSTQQEHGEYSEALGSRVAIPVAEAAERAAHPSSTTALTRLPADHALHLLHQ